MVTIEHEVDRYLTLLRNKIRERGFTQLEIQEVLGWGRSYISQLLTKQKAIRVEQVLLILSVIGVEARVFFTELHGASPGVGVDRIQYPMSSDEPSRQQLEEMTSLLRGLTELLRGKGLIEAGSISEAIEEARRSD